MTHTSSYGSGKRESHDARAFYERFTAPALSDDAEVYSQLVPSHLECGDSRELVLKLPAKSVALVVTSPPYFSGKEYELTPGQGGVPESYMAYLGMLRDVFQACMQALEPGGRIAVNVANLGRKPYRSLSADVIRILQDDLGLLLRGEIIWVKSKGASGSCAWGTMCSPQNPVLRDLSERIIVASKGRFDRAPRTGTRALAGLPHRATITKELFMECTLDLWHMRPASAKRVGHPAPFPEELPARLIQLYTYENDLVLDPFIGSGTTAIAAVRAGRRYAGYDLEEKYIQQSRMRVAAAALGAQT